MKLQKNWMWNIYLQVATDYLKKAPESKKVEIDSRLLSLPGIGSKLAEKLAPHPSWLEIEKDLEQAFIQCVKDETVYSVLADGRKACGEDDLQDVRSHGCERRDAQDVDEHRKRQETTAHPHDGGHKTYDQPAGRDENAGNPLPAGNEIFVEADERRDA